MIFLQDDLKWNLQSAEVDCGQLQDSTDKKIIEGKTNPNGTKIEASSLANSQF